MQIGEVLAMPFPGDTWLPDNCIKSLPKIVCSNQIKSRSILILQYFDDAAVQNTFIVMGVRIFFQFLSAKYNVEKVLHIFCCRSIMSWDLQTEIHTGVTTWTDVLCPSQQNHRKKESLVYQTTPHQTSHIEPN